MLKKWYRMTLAEMVSALSISLWHGNPAILPDGFLCSPSGPAFAKDRPRVFPGVWKPQLLPLRKCAPHSLPEVSGLIKPVAQGCASTPCHGLPPLPCVTSIFLPALPGTTSQVNDLHAHFCHRVCFGGNQPKTSVYSNRM